MPHATSRPRFSVKVQFKLKEKRPIDYSIREFKVLQPEYLYACVCSASDSSLNAADNVGVVPFSAVNLLQWFEYISF